MPTAPCAIGMRRLSIIDLAGGHQPLSQRRRHALARLQWRDLQLPRAARASCRPRATASRPDSDSEVLLHAYASRATTSSQRLNGMFAFALWDARRRRLLIGPRPARASNRSTTSHDGRRLAFASEAKALLELPGVERGARPRARCPAICSSAMSPRRCPCSRASRKLPTGDAAVGRDGRVARRCALTGAAGDGRPRRRAEATGADACARASRKLGADADGERRADRRLPVRRHRLERRRRLHGEAQRRADPHLLDRLRRRRRPSSYYNELPYARQVAQLLRHRATTRSSSSPTSSVCCPSCSGIWTSRSRTRAFITTYLVSEFARQDVTVILSGVGGDELFGGYRRYLGEHYCAYLDGLPRRAASARLPHWRHRLPAIATRAAQPVAAGEELSRQRRAARRRALPRYRAGVRAATTAPRCCGRTVGSLSMRIGAAFATAPAATTRSTACSAVDARHAIARRPAAAHRQDEHGDVARVPRSAARSRAGRACRHGCRQRQDCGRRAQASDEEALGRCAARRHPAPQEARLRRPDGRVAEEASCRRC